MEMTVAARRRLLLEMARRRAQPGTGSARVFLEDRTAVARWPDLTPVLAGIPRAVVGPTPPGPICPNDHLLRDPLQSRVTASRKGVRESEGHGWRRPHRAWSGE